MEEYPYQEIYPMGGTDGEPEPRECKEGGKPMSKQDEPEWAGARHMNFEEDELLLTEDVWMAVFEIIEANVHQWQERPVGKMPKVMTSVNTKKMREQLVSFFKAQLAKAKQHYTQKRLDRSELRKKIFNLLVEARGSIQPKHHPNVLTYKILAYIPDIEEAKKQGIAELLNWLKEYARYGNRVSLEDVLVDIQAHSPYGQTLKGGKNNDDKDSS